ncbi:hypothetical protein [Duganella sp. BuS-21]|uniref:hypothetical protein n=1 Tax=Duganella sp. BuS-21 TaxID=2943848 RepID=UPI0035A71DA4
MTDLNHFLRTSATGKSQGYGERNEFELHVQISKVVCKATKVQQIIAGAKRETGGFDLFWSVALI